LPVSTSYSKIAADRGWSFTNPSMDGMASLATQSVRVFGSTRIPSALRRPSRRGATNSEILPLASIRRIFRWATLETKKDLLTGS
jgi:hypothetical protein